MPSGFSYAVTKFTTFSVIFNPMGEVTRFANGEPIHFNPQAMIFADSFDAYGQTRRLWRMTQSGDVNNYVQDRYGVTALTMFDLSEYEMAGTAGAQYGSKAEYLNDNARLIPLNVHTGLLYERK